MALYVQTTTRSFRGIAEESRRTGAILAKIEPLPSNYGRAQGGLGPNGALIWTGTGNASGGVTPVRMWSPRIGKVTSLEPAGQHGAALTPPVFSGPGNNFAAWELADGSQQEIVEANLGTGVTGVVARGHLGPPVFVGNALVWPASDNPSGHPAHLVAVSAASFPARQAIAVPMSLRAASENVVSTIGDPSLGVAQPSLSTSYGGAVAYLSADLKKLYYSPSPSQPARLVVRAPAGGSTFTPGELSLGPGYLGWETASAESYLASTHSLAAARIVNGTTTWGGLQGLGNNIVVETFAPNKDQQHLSQFHLVSGSTIGALTCASASR
jgi:hypothetical protein